jgi:hypothetical protein
VGDRKKPPADQPMIDGLDVPAHRQGPVELAVRSSVEAAQLDDRDKGAGELAAAAARFVDLAGGRRDPFAGAATVRECSMILTRLRLDPESRDGADAGQIEAWLARLAEPST